MQVVVDGLLTSYERSGKGKIIVILPGWGDSARGWASFAASLALDYEVIVLDLPGFGNTQAPTSIWGLADYALFVAHFLTKTAIKPYAILGHSNGGAITIRGIASGNLSATKLVLIASAGIRGEYKGRNQALRLVTKAGKALTMPLPGAVKRKLRHKVYKTIGSDMLVAEHLQETFKRVVTDDVRTDAAKISTPTLLIYGTNDEATPVRFGEVFQELMKQAKLEVISDAGHFVHLDQPEKVSSLIRGFLQDV